MGRTIGTAAARLLAVACAASIFVVTTATGAQPQVEKPVTDTEKKAFLALLQTLPTAGEFFTEEGVTKAVPYTRVLLALTENDVDKRDTYPFLALSRGLIDRADPRKYGIAHFANIAHPTIKLGWATMLFSQKSATPEIVAFLHKALDSREGAATLEGMTGPGFQEFKERLIRTYERAREIKVVVAKQHVIDALPILQKPLYYVNDMCAFAPERKLYSCRPLKQHGELIVHDFATGSTSHLAIPQPIGFQPEFDFKSYFDDPVLTINSSGDLFCRWTLGGNGDHALALLKSGSKSFVATHVKLVLDGSRAVAQPGGDWFLIEDFGTFTIHRLGPELKQTNLGAFATAGQRTAGHVDARFIAQDVLHLFWGEALSSEGLARMRTIDLDVKNRAWLHNREVYRLEKPAASAKNPTLLQLEDGSLHYLWTIDEGLRQGELTGVYYQAEADGRTQKVSSARDFRAVAAGKLIVFCYTLADSPEKVFFRVINHGALSPVTEIAAAKGGQHRLRRECMILSTQGADRIWFMNTRVANSVFELKLVDANTP